MTRDDLADTRSVYDSTKRIDLGDAELERVRRKATPDEAQARPTLPLTPNPDLYLPDW